jgi:hypothetical protein
METIEDFDNWLAEYKLPEVTYVAVFEPSTGKVQSVGPDYAFPDQVNLVPIDRELAHSIISAEIQIEKCLIDINSGKLEIAEIKTLIKLDDMLHRIISLSYTTASHPAIFLTYTKKTKILKIQLSQEFGGTKKYGTNLKTRNFVWDGNTVMDFLITGYNDPNEIYQMFSITINELIGKNKIIKNLNYDTFSVYTRRLFKHYVIEYK